MASTSGRVQSCFSECGETLCGAKALDSFIFWVAWWNKKVSLMLALHTNTGGAESILENKNLRSWAGECRRERGSEVKTEYGERFDRPLAKCYKSVFLSTL